MSPSSLIAELIANDLAKQGKSLSKKQFEKLRDTITVTNSNFTAELPDDFASAKVETDQITKERVEHLIAAKLKSFNERLPKIVDGTAKALYKLDLPHIGSRSTLLDQRRTSFERRVFARWSEAFDLMNVFLETTTEVGKFVLNSVKRRKCRPNDYLSEVLLRLHARACRVAGEIAALIRAGYADGANARWRTLHEIAVVAMLIQEHGNVLAERYAMHAEIQALKEVVEYETHADKLKHRQVSRSHRTRLQKRSAALTKKYGDDFRHDFGWCALALGKKKPSFTDIEKAVGIEHYGPYVRLANESIHAGSKAVYFSISVVGDAPMPTIAGPTDFGFTDPAQSMSISLNQVTSCLLSLRTDFDMLVKVKHLFIFQTEMVKAFWAAQRRIQREARIPK